MKSFKDFLQEEVAATSTADVAMPPTAMMKKKRKTNIVTRGYIEILGKRKKLTK